MGTVEECSFSDSFKDGIHTLGEGIERLGWNFISTGQNCTNSVEQVLVRDVFVQHAHGARFIRLGGISGAIAIYLGAYGAHVLRKSKADQVLKDTFEIASYYHYIHSLALLAIPMTRRPIITGSLMTTGMLVFCGTCYHHALSGNDTLRTLTPYGAFLLILGWLSISF